MGSLKRNTTNFEMFDSDEFIELLSAYKFQIVIENSIDNYYVTEKIFHAWEAGVVPLYLGAPEIDSFVPGTNSLIDLRHFSVSEAVDLIKRLDNDDAEYLKYHSWREQISLDSSVPFGPLGEMYKQSEDTNPYCTVCKMINDASN